MRTYLFGLFLAAMLCSGCATLFVKKVSTVTIESNPASAEIKDKNGKIFGTTPYTFTPSKDEKYNLVISKKGYEDSEILIRPVVSEGALLGDAMLLCIPCIIDLPSKAYLQFPKAKYKIDLQPSSKKGTDSESSAFSDEAVYANIEEPSISIKDGFVLGKINSSTKKYDSDKEEETLGENTLYTDGVCSEFGKYNITPVSCGVSRYSRDNNSLIPPEKQPYIQADVVSWTFDLKLKSKKYYGTSTLEVNWKIKNPSDKMKVIREKKISFTSDVEERHLKYIFLAMMQRSTAKFITEESVKEFIQNRNQLSPENMKGESVTIVKVTNPAFPKFKDLVSHCTKAVVTIKQKEGFGSGVVISSTGLIITNYHVVDENREVKVKLNTGISLTAKVIKTNPAADLALLKVDAQDIPALPFSIREPEMGEEVIAIGTPGDISLDQTVSKGIISGRRTFEGKKFLQTDLSINPGNSGGPLIDDKGEIVGIITMKLMGRGMEGLGFALSTEEVIKGLNLKIE
ncbi:MAG TPA: trypsin-like peptidase domain-containing protein [Bacteroidia bacterium]|nr:trypsin-like peptidase domain-containing protein [Bacteroidia bacterium]